MAVEAPLVGWGSPLGRSGRLARQSHEPDKQRATEDHGPVPDIETEKVTVGRHMNASYLESAPAH